ncbi:hypothetical protein ACFO3H_11480, partial [Halorussus sp. GCM10023401]
MGERPDDGDDSDDRPEDRRGDGETPDRDEEATDRRRPADEHGRNSAKPSFGLRDGFGLLTDLLRGLDASDRRRESGRFGGDRANVDYDVSVGLGTGPDKRDGDRD